MVPSAAPGTTFVLHHTEADKLNTRVLCGSVMNSVRHQLMSFVSSSAKAAWFSTLHRAAFLLFLELGGVFGMEVVEFPVVQKAI